MTRLGADGATSRIARRLKNTSHGGLRVEQREPVVVRSGSYIASYEPGVVNYNVDACRPPASLGHVEVIVKGTGSASGSNFRIEMKTLV